ncbi:MAG: helix-turn-helix domain-containing protein [Bacteroidetes bacterium]|nr:helix-turn-helix domain-containing protein [Bacteroidota bacterium]
MKQYVSALQPVPFSFRQEKNEPFFEPQPFVKLAKKHTANPVQLKWYAPSSDDFLLLAVKGIDAQTVKELLGFLKSHSNFNPSNCAATSLQDMMNVAVEFTQTEPPVQSSTQTIQIENEPIQDDALQSLFMDSVNEKIEENLGNEHFRGTDLAKLLCCCEMQLYRKIKQLSKLSPANYIRRYRLRRSLRSLQESDLPISQVCFNMGFRSLEYFSRSFKKEFGICPSAYRSGQNVEIVQMNV